MLRTHYRQPIDWTIKSLSEAERTLKEWIALAVPMNIANARPEEVGQRPLDPRVLDALKDDLNTPKAIAEIHSLRNSMAHNTGDTSVIALSDILRFFGLLDDEVTSAQALKRPSLDLDEQEVESLIAARNAARKVKDFKESDRIRDELLAKGIVLKDGPTGTTWEVKR
jgi:cysteinyl-tRNA synthetase